MNTPKECFKNAIKDENQGKKHKGLLITRPDDKTAQEYLNKARINLRLCDLYRQNGYDYKIPEEWFYTLYYCGLAILAKFGIESRSQKCTASFLRYAKDHKVIEYDDEFIDRITVYRDKDEKSDVDEREKARYSSSIKSEEVTQQYTYMTEMCKRAITECEELIFSDKEYLVPKELLE
ncbi:MAG: hypothetical protein AABX47_00055 [Nanoarchaeota archaeon]